MVSLSGPMSSILQRSPPVSPASLVWTLIDTGFLLSAFVIRQMSFGAGTFVCPYNAGDILTSPDASTWSITSTELLFSTTAGCTFGGGQFILGNAFAGSPEQIATSPDGFIWESQVSAFGASGRNNAIAYNGTTYVIGGFNNFVDTFNIQTSPDGVTWIARDSSITVLGSAIHGVTFGAGTFVAISNAGEISTSPTGVSWTLGVSPFPLSFETRTNVLYNGSNLFVAHSGSLVATSPDGFVWILQSIPVVADWRGVCFGLGRWLLGVGSTIITSSDGASWIDNSASLPVLSSDIRSAIFANGLHVLECETVGNHAFLITSLIP